MSRNSDTDSETASPGVRKLAVHALAAAAAAILTLAGTPQTAVAQETICDRGDTEVRKLSFSGNLSFPDRELEIRIVTTPSSSLYRLFRVFGAKRCLDRQQLPYDVLRLISFYRERGFPEVRVELDTATVRTGAMVVAFNIDEGAPRLVGAVSVRGLGAVADSARIASLFTAAPGARLDRTIYSRDAERVATALRNTGYPSADVALAIDTADVRARVTLDVTPGPLTRVSSIHVLIEKDSSRGDKPPAISEATVRRLLGFKEGELVSARRMLDAQRNLFYTDAYRNVQLRPAPDSLQPDSDSLMAIQALLVEGTSRDLRVGVGWGTLDCFRSQATYTDRSFFGGARRFELGGRLSKIGLGYPLHGAEELCRRVAREDIYSDTLNYRLGFTLRQPGIFGLAPQNAPTLSLYSEQRSEYLAYFRSVPIGFAASLTRDLTPLTRAAVPLSVSYSMEYGRTQAQPAVYCALFNLCGDEERDRIRRLQRLGVASVGVGRDSRDFPLDPTRGSLAQMEWRHASTAVLSDRSLQFNSFTADFRRYWALGGGVVLSARLRGGLVMGQQLRLVFGASSGDQVVRVSGYVPPAERLYAGGPSSVRGFRFNELGPEVYIVSSYDTVAAAGDTVYYRARNEVRPDRSVPAGGNTMVVGNVEVRVPSPFLRDIITYAAFVDGGEVWNRGSSIGTAEAKFDGFKITPGVGLRIYSPVGPVRVDIGYNPYQRRAGTAYFDAPVGEGGVAPLYCVSPGNTLKVVPADTPGRPPVQLTGSGACGSTFTPEGRSGLRRLTFNFSIGQAF